MWLVAGVNKKLEGPLGSYSVLTDRYLSHYFSNPTIKQHLIGMGLIRKDGSIIPESVYRRKHEDRLRKKMANEALASAIFKKTIDLEMLRKSEIERHLDELTKVETVERIRSARTKRRNLSAPARYKENRQNYSTREKSAPPSSRKHRMDKKFKNTGNLSRPLSTPNLNVDQFNNMNFDDIPKDDDGSSLASNCTEIYKMSNYQLSRPKSAHPRRRAKPSVPSTFETIEKYYAHSSNALLIESVSPYLRPLLSTSMENVSTKHRNFSARGQRSEPVTIRDLLDWTNESERYQTRKKKVVKTKKSPSSRQNYAKPPQSKATCYVTLKYLGSPLLQKIDPGNRKQEIMIKQQHCGGTPILVYKGIHVPGDFLTFPSRRHRGYPFSVMVFVDEINNLRLSACCEHRYQVGAKLGGAQGHFVLHKVEGGALCIKCKAEIQLGIERPKHPQPKENLEKKAIGTEKEPKSRSKSAAPHQLAFRSATPDVLKTENTNIHRLNPNLPNVIEDQNVKSPVDSLKELETNSVIERSTDSESDVEKLEEEVPDEAVSSSEEESVEEEINASNSINPSYSHSGGQVQLESTRASSPEDAIPGDYETAEFTHDFSDEEEFENDYDIPLDQMANNNDDEPTAMGVDLIKGKTTTIVIRPDSAMNRISLPKSHWGARDPSLEPPSYSSDDEDQRIERNKITLVTVDVHANPSRPSSQMNAIPNP